MKLVDIIIKTEKKLEKKLAIIPKTIQEWLEEMWEGNYLRRDYWVDKIRKWYKR